MPSMGVKASVVRVCVCASVALAAGVGKKGRARQVLGAPCSASRAEPARSGLGERPRLK